MIKKLGLKIVSREILQNQKHSCFPQIKSGQLIITCYQEELKRFT